MRRLGGGFALPRRPEIGLRKRLLGAATPCGRTMLGTGRMVGEEGTSVNVPSAATLRTFRPLAVAGDVNDPPWVTTCRNFSVESRANWKQLPVVLSLTCWISIGSVGSRLMS